MTNKKQLPNVMRLDGKIEGLFLDSSDYEMITTTVDILDGVEEETYKKYFEIVKKHQSCKYRFKDKWTLTNFTDSITKHFEKETGLNKETDSNKQKVINLAKSIYENSEMKITYFHENRFKPEERKRFGKRYATKAEYIEIKDGIFRKTQKFYDEVEDRPIYELAKKWLNGKVTLKEVYARTKVRGQAQRFFRILLMEIYKEKCVFCGMNIKSVLNASHIVPWSEATSEQKIDPKNGILLCANHHILFDSGVLSFDDNYEIIEGKNALNDNQKRWVQDVLGKKMSLPDKDFYPNVRKSF
ncbi:MAG TPA: HNH endonuclease [bacterium]|nr:HNH endonuclease [bacterium]